jgi:hypothetical protein
MKHQLPSLLLICLVTYSLNSGAQNVKGVAVRFFAGETEVDATKGVELKNVPQLLIKVVPDNEMAAAHPNAKYEIRSWRMYLRRGTDLGTSIEGSGEDLHLNNFMGQKGDVIVVEVSTVIRVDADGKREKLAPTTELKYATIAVR